MLDTRSGQTGWIHGETRTFTLARPAPHTRYRLRATNDNDASAQIVVVSIGDTFMHGH